jgi:hypothetical protein
MDPTLLGIPSFDQLIEEWGSVILGGDSAAFYRREFKGRHSSSVSAEGGIDWQAAAQRHVVDSQRHKHDALVRQFSQMRYPLSVYRLIRLEDGIDSLNHGHIGVCWTWDEEAADNFRGGSDNYIFKAEVSEEYIDWSQTFARNLHATMGEPEREVTLKYHASVDLIGYRPQFDCKWVEFAGTQC